MKHDGYRIIARKDGGQVRLWSRNDRDWSGQLAAIREALLAFPANDIVMDGEAVAHCVDGVPRFNGLRSEEGAATACLFAFDLLWHDGNDLRRSPLEERRARLEGGLRRAPDALRFGETAKATDRAYSGRPVHSVCKASCRSGGIAGISQADVLHG
jgi:bifunctional non-homologous end joining protein LigD